MCSHRYSYCIKATVYGVENTPKYILITARHSLSVGRISHCTMGALNRVAVNIIEAKASKPPIYQLPPVTTFYAYWMGKHPPFLFSFFIFLYLCYDFPVFISQNDAAVNYCTYLSQQSGVTTHNTMGQHFEPFTVNIFIISNTEHL